MRTTYLCIIYFLSQPFFSPNSRWPILFFTQDIVSLMLYNIIVKSSWPSICKFECCGTIWHTFPKIYRYETGVKTGGNSVKPVHYFPHLLLLVYFCFPCQICADVQFYGENQNKCKSTIVDKCFHFLQSGTFFLKCIFILHFIYLFYPWN